MEILGATMIALFIIGIICVIMHDCGLKQGSIIIFSAVCGTVWIVIGSALISGRIA